MSNTYLLWNLETDDWTRIKVREYIDRFAVPMSKANLLLVDVSHWDEDDYNDWAQKSAGDRLGQLEHIAVVRP